MAESMTRKNLLNHDCNDCIMPFLDELDDLMKVYRPIPLIPEHTIRMWEIDMTTPDLVPLDRIWCIESIWHYRARMLRKKLRGFLVDARNRLFPFEIRRQIEDDEYED
jgi:hypothetical protein